MLGSVLQPAVAEGFLSRHLPRLLRQGLPRHWQLVETLRMALLKLLEKAKLQSAELQSGFVVDEQGAHLRVQLLGSAVAVATAAPTPAT